MLGDICISNLTIIDSDNGLSPGRRQASTWTNSGILWIGPLGTNFSEILIGIHTFSYKKMHLELSHAKWEPFCLALNMFTHYLLLSYDIPFVHMCQMLVWQKSSEFAIIWLCEIRNCETNPRQMRQTTAVCIIVLLYISARTIQFQGQWMQFCCHGY